MTKPKVEPAPGGPQEPLTVDEIISLYFQTMSPVAATARWPRGSEALCVMPVIERVKMESGEIRELLWVDGKDKDGRPARKHGAGYMRVSTIMQRSARSRKADAEEESEEEEDAPSKRRVEDGFSEDDQLRRIIWHFIEKRQAFAIYTDCGIGGGTPYFDPDLIEKLNNIKADRTEERFREVFLSTYIKDDLTDEDRADIERYIRAKAAAIRGGGAEALVVDDGLFSDDKADGEHFTVTLKDEDFQDVEEEPSDEEKAERLHRKRPSAGRTNKFRPALTFLIRHLPRVHSLVVTDRSRISRALSLSIHLGETFAAHKVDLVGLVEPINDKGNNMLTSLVMYYVADQKLNEVLSNAFRGYRELLRSGRLQSHPPFWLRSVGGFARLRRQKGADGRWEEHDSVKCVRLMIKLYLEGDATDRGYQKVGNLLMSHGYRSPLGKLWTKQTIKAILMNRMLIGKQRIFGKVWDLAPPIIDERTWYRLQARMYDRSKRHDYRTADGDHDYLGARLFRCNCGRAMETFTSTKGSVSWCCPVTRSTLKEHREEGAHAWLSYRDTAKFLNGWFSSQPQAMFRQFQDDEAELPQTADLLYMQQKLHEREQELAAKEDAAREKAQKLYGSLGWEGSEVERHVVMFIQTDTRAEQEEVVVLKGHIATKKLEMATYTPSADQATLSERMAAWGELTIPDKNQVMQALISKLQVCGEPPNEYVEVTPRMTPQETFIIRLRTTVVKMPNGVNYRRRFPTQEEWLQDDLDQVQGAPEAADAPDPDAG